MKVGFITCMTCMFAVALTLGGPIRRQSSQSEKTVPIGGNVTLLCPLIPNVIWVYWKKNDFTIYSFEVQSNTQHTRGTRYESSNHATRFTIKDLKKTDGGIYHCKVATNDTTSDNIKEGGRVLLSVTDQEGGLFTNSPCVPFGTSTTTPPEPAEYNTTILAFSISTGILFLIIIIIISVFVFKYQKLRRSTSTPMPADSSHRKTRDEEGTSTNLLSLGIYGRDDEDVDGRREEKSHASKSIDDVFVSVKSSIHHPQSDDNSNTTDHMRADQDELNADDVFASVKSSIHPQSDDISNTTDHMPADQDELNADDVFISAKSSVHPLSDDNCDTTEHTRADQDELNAEPQPSQALDLSRLTRKQLETLIHDSCAPTFNDQVSAIAGRLKDEIKGPMIKQIYAAPENKKSIEIPGEKEKS